MSFCSQKRGGSVCLFLALLVAIPIMTSCATGTINVAGTTPESELATITAAHRFYLFADYDCGITQASGASLGSHAGAKTARVPEGLIDLSLRCAFVIPYYGGHVYSGEVNFLAQAGHEYTVLFENTRKCIVVVDEGSDAKVAEDCALSSYFLP